MRAEPNSPTAALGEFLQGDCLDVLSGFTGDLAQTFDLVYLDPPFNVGKVWGARLSAGERARGATAYLDSWGGLDGFLRMLEPRLVAVRAVMSQRASLWLHLDHRTVHHAKVACDRIFGCPAFRGEIIWLPGNGARSSRGPSITHQTILVYARGREMIWNLDDPQLRESYAQTSLRMHFRQQDEQGRTYRERRIAGKVYRYYADHGRRLGSVWSDCPAMRANTPLVRETTGYPTQEPESLLERILRAASLPGSRILDPMCGSGTALVVAERLGRSWLGIDQSELAIQIAQKRLERSRNSAEKRTG